MNSQELFAAIEVKGLTVEGIRGMHVASLRYFDPAGNFAERGEGADRQSAAAAPAGRLGDS